MREAEVSARHLHHGLAEAQQVHGRAHAACHDVLQADGEAELGAEEARDEEVDAAGAHLAVGHDGRERERRQENEALAEEHLGGCVWLVIVGVMSGDIEIF